VVVPPGAGGGAPGTVESVAGVLRVVLASLKEAAPWIANGDERGCSETPLVSS
jgi:hypothetical protein